MFIFFSMNCICTDSAPTDDQKTDDSDCDTSCVGNSSETCGGEDRIQIYDLNSKMIEHYYIIIL